MAGLFIRNRPAEAENGSPGKDTLPISATVTRRIWLKVYGSAGQPVANAETRIRHRSIPRSLPKYPVTVSKRNRDRRSPPPRCRKSRAV